VQHLHPEQVEVELWRADQREVRRGLSAARDEMGSDVRRPAKPRWFWHAIEHHTGRIVAAVCGRRQDDGFLKLQS
jgi:insertion element IS1 protein InsB